MIETVEVKIRKKKRTLRRVRTVGGGGGMISREGFPACLRNYSVTSHSRAEPEYCIIKPLIILKLPPALHRIETSNVCSIR